MIFFFSIGLRIHNTLATFIPNDFSILLPMNSTPAQLRPMSKKDLSKLEVHHYFTLLKNMFYSKNLIKLKNKNFLNKFYIIN